MATAETRRQLLTALAACEDKKGEDTRILELDPADSGLADFFLITSATNDRQVVAIADEIELRLKREYGLLPSSVEGRRQAEWILLDYVDIVIHVFLAEKRAFYDIERLRKSARNMASAQAEAELKTALAAKTRAVRTGIKGTPASLAKKKAASQSLKGESDVAAKAAKKAVKKAAKKAAKSAPAKKAAKKAVKKAAKPAPAKKSAAKKAPAKKAAAKKAVAKKAPAKAAKKAVKAPLKQAVKKLPGKTKPPVAVKKAAKKKTTAPLPAPADNGGQVPVPVPVPNPPVEPIPLPPPPPEGPVKPPVVKED